MLLRRIGDDDVAAAEQAQDTVASRGTDDRSRALRAQRAPPARVDGAAPEVEFEVQALLSEPVKPSEQSVWVFVVLHPVVPGDPESPRWSWRACRTTQRAQLVEVKRQAEHDAAFECVPRGRSGLV